MTLLPSLTGARAIFSIAALSRGRVPLAVCLSVFLLGFAALEISAQEEPTRLDELFVSDGEVRFLNFVSGACIRINGSIIGGVYYFVHSSKWQRRSGAGSPWEDIPGTAETDALCAFSPESEGEYRLVADITIGDERGLYKSNTLFDPEPPEPGQVTGVRVAEGVEQLTVLWNEMTDSSRIWDGASGYKVEWKSGSESYRRSRSYVVDSGSITTYTITGLTAGTEYTVRVTATLASTTGGFDRDGKPSDEVTGTPLAAATVPGQPTGLTATAGDGAVTLSWEAPASTGGSAILRYEYRQGTSGTFMSVGTALTATVTGLTNGQSYTFWVRAVNRVGNGEAASVTARPVATANDATLSALVLSDGASEVTLTPAFDPATQSYTATVANSVASVTVTPTVNDPDAAVTVNGAAVASGSPSDAIDLEIGENVIEAVVTAQDGTTTSTYTVTVTRATANDATLSALVLFDGTSEVTLTPAFDSATQGYAATVANSVMSVTVTPTVTDSSAAVTVNGAAVASGSPSDAIDLEIGENVIEAVVTAQDGTTTSTYTVTVTRATAVPALPLGGALLLGILLVCLGARRFYNLGILRT